VVEGRISEMKRLRLQTDVQAGKVKVTQRKALELDSKVLDEEIEPQPLAEAWRAPM
jgi:hypothetical protein